MTPETEYNLKFAIVKKAIDDFNPMNLLPHALG